MDVIEALKKLGGKATSQELLELLAPEVGPLRARQMIAEAVRSGKIKKVKSDKKEIFVLEAEDLEV